MATSVELQNDIATYTPSDKVTDFKILPGLVPGDVIVGVGDDKIMSAERVGALLLDSVGSKQPIKLSIRRGLPNPFLTHPRLDLFVGDASPHNMGTFGCTICHEGQGNGTAFKWTSHTPNDDASEPDESVRWAKE